MFLMAINKSKSYGLNLKSRFIIGIDEVGRGCLAGPVVVAALALTRNLEFRIDPPGIRQWRKQNSELPLRDSKKLNRRQREIWFKYIKNHPRIFYTIKSVSPKIIDKINISNAANLAASIAAAKLIKNYKLTLRGFANGEKKIKNCRVFLDGGLFLNSKFLILNSTTVVRGDEKIPAIMLASIAAKVTRDKKMRLFHKKYPQYDFINNVGYGTKKHRRAIRKHGLSAIHRRSFRIKK